MIPDNIQANIMKYLNNGVSGSSQEQKPKVLPGVIQVNQRIYTQSNVYVTTDNQFMIFASFHSYDGTNLTHEIIISNVEKAIDGEIYAKYEIPLYGSYVKTNGMSSIDRDEEGRFYGMVNYENSQQQQHEYLVIFNDFLTDGILQINKAYRIDNITINSHQLGLLGVAKKIDNKAEYFLYDRYPSSSNEGVYIAKISINVGENIETKLYRFYLDSSSTDNANMIIRDITINTTNETPFMLIGYNTTTIVEGLTYPTNYKIAKIIFYEEDTSSNFIELTKQVLYTNNSYYGTQDYQLRGMQDNGMFIQTILTNVNGNTVTLKYLMVRADGTKIILNFPNTYTIPNFDRNENISIQDNLIFIGIWDKDEPHTLHYRHLYQINFINNSITFIQDIGQDPNIPTSEITIIKQFNIYFVFSTVLWIRLYKIIDVPIYGRDCLLKQKLLNSKLFRAFKFKRNRRANIQ